VPPGRVLAECPGDEPRGVVPARLLAELQIGQREVAREERDDHRRGHSERNELPAENRTANAGVHVAGAQTLPHGPDARREPHEHSTQNVRHAHDERRGTRRGEHIVLERVENLSARRELHRDSSG
jgi:hypothetical protein